MKKCDILCIQEHWLHTYEGKDFPNHNYSIKCADDASPELPNMRIRETAGIAIIWKESINHIIEPLPDSSDRVHAIWVNTANSPLLIVNTYMSMLGAAKADYEQTLDEVYEVISKYN